MRAALLRAVQDAALAEEMWLYLEPLRLQGHHEGQDLRCAQNTCVLAVIHSATLARLSTTVMHQQLPHKTCLVYKQLGIETHSRMNEHVINRINQPYLPSILLHATIWIYFYGRIVSTRV